MKNKELLKHYAEWLASGQLPIGLSPLAKKQIKKIYMAWAKDGRDSSWVEKMKNAKPAKSLGGG